jgi:hypothetical protein
LQERRVTTVRVNENAYVFDIVSEVGPAGDIPVALGPTRHAWFNARIADGIALSAGAAPVDDAGRRGANEIPANGPGLGGLLRPGGRRRRGGHHGAAPRTCRTGVVRVGLGRPHRWAHSGARAEIAPGETARFACRFIAHDGPAPAADRLGNSDERTE